MTQFDFLLLNTPIPDCYIEEFFRLGDLLFENNSHADTRWRLENMPDVSASIAQYEGSIVGFKLGYAVTSKRYYSWLGGVHPDFVRRGIAKQLTMLQHNWVIQHKYRVIETETGQSNHAMAALNEQSGFEVAGYKFDKNRPRTIYRKPLPTVQNTTREQNVI